VKFYTALRDLRPRLFVLSKRIMHTTIICDAMALSNKNYVQCQMISFLEQINSRKLDVKNVKLKYFMFW
jgi:hypothetical protein